MHWDDLRFFLSVARAGQIGRAAPLLRADPTTVSRRIRRLEAELGQVLFEQAREGQRLTAAGRSLLVRAEEMERCASAIGEESAGEGKASGVLRISVSEGFGTWVVAPHLHHFATGHPAITIDLTASSGFLSPSKRETDIAILLARPRRGPLLTRKLTDYTLGLYAARQYLEETGGVLNRNALSAHRVIGYIPDQLYAPELDYLAELLPGLEAHLRSSSINAQHRLCHAGAGLAILPDFIGSQDGALQRVLLDFTLHRAFWIAIHQDVRNLARVSLFNDWLTELVNEKAGLLKWRSQ
ncbi:LysR family transcriptional regulator [Rhizorhapis suberifaciens]|uniref:DNA-binding transcriptional LysR family regulator n=1 Tax=Rhizorhapis suberifaciens TaxID=13656 RepID=A0A840HWI9_9SPHN|nr:LysR family transcriptional regulator [Rhizorhapis suberifaciens]MBB4642031.1 DNA-binding transcriptional LysR family regulator [Rhizorhapis suberifaciens]